VSYRRVAWFRAVLAAGWLAGLLLSARLWLGPRLYPRTPVWPLAAPFPFLADRILFTAALVLLLLIAVRPKPAFPIAALLAVMAALAFEDQSRWQPWVYQYFMLTAALGLLLRARAVAEERHAAWNTCRLIVVCTYLWSGLQKLNSDFTGRVFDWLTEPATRFLPARVTPWVHLLGFTVPAIEAAIGVGLLVKRLRPAAVLSALAMHAWILLALGPLGRNYNAVVWPWNVAMALSAVLLFWKTEDFPVQEVIWGRRFGFQTAILVLLGIAPLLSFFDRWDTGLSLALYTGNKNVATISMSDATADRLPDEVLDYVTVSSEEDELDVDAWSMGELHVPPYPEARVFRNVARSVCGYTHNPPDLKLVIEGRTALFHPPHTSVWRCSALVK